MAHDEYSQDDKYRYSTARWLGSGAFSDVYLGTRTGSDEPVAVKRVDRSKMIKSQHLRLLRAEIDILTTLSHPGVVSLFHHEATPAFIILYLEYCNQGSLLDQLKRNNTLPVSTIRHIMRQLSSVLAYIHKQNIVHRDIKPANILIHGTGSIELSAIKLADFGFARHLPSQDMAATFCGSPLYMAPEVLTGATYDTMVDMWGAGIVAYQCLVGHAPYHAKSIRELQTQLKTRREGVGYPSNMCPKLRDLIDQLLKMNPVTRLSGDAMCRHPFFVDRQRTVSEPTGATARGPPVAYGFRSLAPSAGPPTEEVSVGCSSSSGYELIDHHQVQINQLADAMEPRPVPAGAPRSDLLCDRLVLLDSVCKASRHQKDDPVREVIIKGRLLMLLRETTPIACFGSKTDLRHYRDLFNQTIARIGELKKTICSKPPDCADSVRSAEELIYEFAMTKARDGAAHAQLGEDCRSASSYMESIVLMTYLRSIASEDGSSLILDRFITSTHTRMKSIAGAAVRYCGGCGTPFEEGHRFCSFCGEPRDHYTEKVKQVERSLLGSSSASTASQNSSIISKCRSK